MKLLSSLLVAAAQAANLCNGGTTPLLSAVCSDTGFTITIDETCRQADYAFIDWTSAFVSGDITAVTETTTDAECDADGSGAAWQFVTPFSKCGVVIPTTPGAADAEGITWYEYKLYLNFDHTIATNGVGNLQQLGQTMITCKVPANLQENGQGVVTITDPDIIEDLEQEVQIWSNLKLSIDKGGTDATASWGGVDLGATPSIGLGEHVKLYLTETSATTYNYAMHDCWASTAQDIRDTDGDTTDDDDGEVNFNVAGNGGAKTIRFLEAACPKYFWVTSDAVANHGTIDKLEEITLRQFAFQDADADPTAGDFWYHCEISVCLPGVDCVPDPTCATLNDFAPTGRRRRAIVSKRVTRSTAATEAGVDSPRINIDMSACDDVATDGEIVTCANKSARSSSVAASLGFLTGSLVCALH